MMERGKYSEAFKAAIVQKVCGPGGRTAPEVAREAGLSKSTVYTWVKRSRRKAMRGKNPGQRQPEDWSPSEKLKALLDTAGLTEAELGAWLRKKGLHSKDLERWRNQAQEGLSSNVSRVDKKALQAATRKVKGLERELTRKNAALAETAALLVLSKKVNAFLGDEGENT